MNLRRPSVALGLLTLGCTGAFLDKTPPGESGGPNVMRGPAQSAMERLTQREYENTFRAAFEGTAFPAEVTLPSDSTDGVFIGNAPELLGDFEPYIGAAEALAIAAAPNVSSCAWSADALACARSELAGPLRILYRRPPVDGDFTALASLFEQLRADDVTEADALQLTIARALLSADFLFRVELGVEKSSDGEGVVLNDHEIAARLAYFMTDAPPDESLRAAAEDGRLRDRAVLREHAERLFDSQAGSELVWEFVRRWLDFDRLDARADDALEASMVAETRAFVEHVMHADRAPFADLLTADYSFVDRTMAEHYGLEGGGDTPERVDLTPLPERRGILTHASLLTALTLRDPRHNLIPRGRVVYTRLLCGQIATPDANLVNEPVEDRTADVRCAGCHLRMDPIGQGFEGYDSLGRYDAALAQGGLVREVGAVDGTFATIPELAERIAASPELADCTTQMLFRFGLGRLPGSHDADSLAAIDTAMRERGSFRDALLAFVTSDAFVNRYDPPESQACER
jgi:hypothetical protein